MEMSDRVQKIIDDIYLSSYVKKVLILDLMRLTEEKGLFTMMKVDALIEELERALSSSRDLDKRIMDLVFPDSEVIPLFTKKIQSVIKYLPKGSCLIFSKSGEQDYFPNDFFAKVEDEKSAGEEFRGKTPALAASAAFVGYMIRKRR